VQLKKNKQRKMQKNK